jgi:phosphatidylserine decarboxylase
VWTRSHGYYVTCKAKAMVGPAENSRVPAGIGIPQKSQMCKYLVQLEAAKAFQEGSLSSLFVTLFEEDKIDFHFDPALTRNVRL